MIFFCAQNHGHDGLCLVWTCAFDRCHWVARFGKSDTMFDQTKVVIKDLNNLLVYLHDTMYEFIDIKKKHVKRLFENKAILCDYIEKVKYIAIITHSFCRHRCDVEKSMTVIHCLECLNSCLRHLIQNHLPVIGSQIFMDNLKMSEMETYMSRSFIMADFPTLHRYFEAK